MSLTAEEARVIGSLVEKELTTPDQYPLTIRSLLAACNQASNRDPVVDYDEGTVMAALDSLKGQRLIRFVLPSHGRTAVRYRQVLNEALGLAALMRAAGRASSSRSADRGRAPARTERMTVFDGLDEIDHQLRFLSEVAEPLAISLGRRPGQKEERWATPLVAVGRQDRLLPPPLRASASTRTTTAASRRTASAPRPTRSGNSGRIWTLCARK